MLLRFAYPFLLWVLLPVYVLVLVYRLKFYRYPRYIFPLSLHLASAGFAGRSSLRRIVLFVLRAASLLLLVVFAARPQWVDERSIVNVNGVDIVIALDVSGSMQAFDDLNDRRTRIDVAKKEAIRFVEKRTSDPIGLVLFGADAISRCPLTLDKSVLKDIIGRIELGVIDPNATALGTGLAVAVSRLKNSKAKSQIVVLLTDGLPSPEAERIDPVHAIDLAKQLGIKVYTVGIGGEKGVGYIQSPYFGIQAQQMPLNVVLLQKIASETGGQFFRAKNPADMRAIYDKIDQLEKTEIETNLFHNYYEAFLHLIWLVFLLISLEYGLRLFLWRGM
jgi:Ca-activated chloride channel family protein